MALSGSFSKQIRTGYGIRVDWTATQNVANNTSTITSTLYFINDYSIAISSRSNTITIDGTSYSVDSAAISTIGAHKIGSKSKTVSHNSDGTKTVSLGACFNLKATLSGVYYEKIEASSNATLNTIPRCSKPTTSASACNFGSKVTINTNRASSAFTHKLYQSFGNINKELIASDVGASYEYTVPLSLASQIPHKKSGVLTITCETYNGASLIGTATTSITVNVPQSMAPTINSISLEEGNATVKALALGCYVQQKSQLKATINAIGTQGAWISSYSTTIEQVAYNGATITSSVLKTSGTIEVTSTVVDSRGMSATVTKEVPIVAYASPVPNAFSVKRCDSTGTEDLDGGEYCLFTYEYNISTVNNKNTVNVALQYLNGSKWESLKTITSGYNDKGTYNSTITFDVDKTHQMRMVITDIFGSVAVEDVLPSTFTLVNFNKYGDGIAFGKPSTKRNAAEFGLTLYDADNNVIKGETAQSVLWQGVSVLGTDNTITLKSPVSAQRNGIVLIFSRLDNATSQSLDSNYVPHFVPKQAIALFNKRSFSFTMISDDFANVGVKTVVISDTELIGVKNNATYGTTCGVEWKNSRWCLRAVIGL